MLRGSSIGLPGSDGPGSVSLSGLVAYARGYAAFGGTLRDQRPTTVRCPETQPRCMSALERRGEHVRRCRRAYEGDVGRWTLCLRTRTGDREAMVKRDRSGSPWRDRARCREMAEDEFWDRFADADVRIAAQVVTGRATISVSHVVEDGRLMFCSASGEGAREFLAHSLMSVQIDGYNAREAFTVSMIGYAEAIAPRSEALGFVDLASQPPPATERAWVRFVPMSIAGRIFAVDADLSTRKSSTEARLRGTTPERQLLTP